ncbi:hypothetical protein KHA94_05845 [Bacillus sp. FJAT-49705]|uniref:Uncharacterized protein n=2 Tax=Cytobacillus TaxID=2675230 RepID=A0A5B8Z4W5_CYTDA|nr:MULTISPECIES: hypothetical protein [Cytobacillus]MBS4189730.1 hypothetical protein [Cytobacillus citreus]QED47971.1 hypothetical protein FSZ17_12350 [Cytobacillus dafuensis]
MEYFIGLAVSIACCVYLVIDAPKHGKSPVLWGILGFILGLLGLGIYLIATGRKVLGWIIVALFILFIIVIIILIVLFFSLFMSFSGF